MNGFTEAWLRDHQAKRHRERLLVAAPDSKSRAGVPRGQKELDGREEEFRKASEQMTLQELGRHFGLSEITVSRMRRHLGIKGTRRATGGKLAGREEEFIRDHNSASDKDLSARFGVSESGLQKWRDRLGIKKDPAVKWVHTEHPRGALGMKHSDELKLASGARSRTMWDNPASYVNSDAYRQVISDRSTALQASGIFRKGHSRCASGVRADIGPMFFRSSWEANYARYLNFLVGQKQIHHWEYEPETFWFEEIRRGVRSYKPDFKVWERLGAAPYFVELKGWMDDKSKTKLKRMAKYHPHIQIQVVGEREYKAIAATLRGVIPNWERRAQIERIAA